MGGALLGGLLGTGVLAATDVAVVEPVAERRGELEALYPGLRTLHAPEADLLEASGDRLPGVVLAVKPDAAEAACRALAVSRAGVAASSRSWPACPVSASRWPSAASRPSSGPCPTWPRWSARGVAAMSGGSFATSQDLAWAEEVLASVGTVVRLPEQPARCGDRPLGLGSRRTSSWPPRRSSRRGCRWASPAT